MQECKRKYILKRKVQGYNKGKKYRDVEESTLIDRLLYIYVAVAFTLSWRLSPAFKVNSISSVFSIE